MSAARSAPRELPVRNPRTGEYDYRFTPPSAAELQALAQRLRAAQPAWRDGGLDARIAALRRYAEALTRHRDAIVAALALDTGRTLIAHAELAGTLAAIERWCRSAPELLREVEGVSGAQPGVRFVTQRVPYPLVGAISPWNFPLVLGLIDAIPALLAGCAVLVKPSDVTPRFAVPLARALAEVPELAAVFAIEPGPAETGAALVGLVDAVCFTGSVRTGRLVAEACARAFIPAFLELGGKDPVIVTASVDVARAAATVLRGSVLATGQACQSIERVYVDARIHDAFVAELVAGAQAVGITWPDPAQGVLGPFIWAPQAQVVAAQIADALAKGARLHTGGTLETHGGHWLRPTVLTEVTHAMTVMTQETFGPVLPVMRYRTVDEAVRLANDGEYGLSAAVLAGTLAEAEAIGRRLEVGAVSLNDCALTGTVHESEKDSFRCSGLGGSRMGASGLLRFSRRKALLFQTGEPAPLAAFTEHR